jgi:hypothetical protein
MDLFVHASTSYYLCLWVQEFRPSCACLDGDVNLIIADRAMIAAVDVLNVVSNAENIAGRSYDENWRQWWRQTLIEFPSLRLS